ncbi:hypothetical protein ACFL9S_02485 [Erwinia sp. AnSW2-5]|uniref:hypothetical protein n=1 Tax=Erwinia sp. AnSW2-5 TaxID=3367692 RepID=UPI00385E3669
MNSTQYKKELLYRKANGKMVFESYLSKINSLVCCNVDALNLLSLEFTDDVLKKSLMNERRSIKNKIENKLLSEFFDKIKKYDSGFFVFIDDDWKYCGAFLISSLNSLRDDFSFGDNVLNNVLLISDDFSIYIDLDYYEMMGENYIDVKESLR